MALELILRAPGYENWVKGGLALQYARDGIENFVETNTDKFHQDVMNSLPAGANCRNCSTENIIPCKNNNNYCKIVNHTCKVHDQVDQSKQSKPICPNFVCDAIRNAITKEHRFNGPSWKNTDCTRWSREPWQLAKCFMTDGYRSLVSAADTDFPGLLSVVINNKVFNNVVSDNLSSRKNIFSQARQVRNDILHKPDMKLTDQELADHIAILDIMLSDNTCLAANPDAVYAKVMLNKILTDQINISSEEERQVRALREIERKQQESLAKIEAKTEDAVEVVMKEMNDAKDDLESKTKELQTTATDNIKQEQLQAATVYTIYKGEIETAKNNVVKASIIAKKDIKTEMNNVIIAIKKQSIDAKDSIKVVKDGAIKEAKIELKTATEVVKQEINLVKDDIQIDTKESIKAIAKELCDAKDHINAVKDGAIKEAKIELKTATEVVKQEINLVKGDIQIDTKESIKAIAKELSDAKDNIKSVKEDAIKDAKIELETSTEAAKKEINLVKGDIQIETKESIKAIAKESSDAKDHIKSVKEDAIKDAKIELKTSTEATKKEIYLAKDDIQIETKVSIKAIAKESSDANDHIKSVKEDAIKDAKIELKTSTEAAKKEINLAKDDIQIETKVSIKAIEKESSDANDHIKSVKEDAIKDAKKELKTSTEVVKKEINLAKDDIQIETKESIKAIAKESSDAKDHIKSVKEGAIKDAKIELKTATEEAVTALTKAVRGTHKGTQPSVKTEQPKPQPVQQPRKLTSKMLKDIKTKLLKVYRKSDRLSAPLFPLVQNEDMTIDELYVKPYMKHKNTAIDSFKDLFRCGDQRSIFVVGDAGLGKTSLCQKLISTWCQVHSDTKRKMKRNSILHNIVSMFRVKSGKKDLISDDLQAMAQFDFLFYVSLREAVDESDIEEMIKNQLLDREFHDQVSVVLENETCLVILDGLDEWAKNNSGAKMFCNKGIPGRKASENLTVFTTTRPWKLDAIEMKQTQIGTRIELLGIEETSSKQLIQIMLTYINKDKDKKCHMIMEDLLIELAKKNLEHFMAIPVILKQLICLWSSGKDLGQTPTVIYCQMMELLLELAQNRMDKKPAYKQKKDECVNSAIQLPSCFDGNDTCQEYKPLIFLLSKLAFNAIFSKDKESALVFKRTLGEIHGMTESDIDISLNIGILSQSSIIKSVKSQRKLSFLHKSYQEFLAALFIALDIGECDQHVERIQQHCTTLSELIEMEHLLKFIGGMCSSDTLCVLLGYIKSMDTAIRYLQNIVKNGLKENWCCSHDNEHLFTDTIDINPEDKPEHIELMCQVNIKHLRYLTIRFPPTAQCVEYLQQVHTLSKLNIELSIAVSSRSSRFSPISEDIMNDLVLHVQNMFIIWTKPQLAKELSSSTSSKSTPISEENLNDLIHHRNNIVRILYERRVVIDPSSSSYISSSYMVGENNRNDFRQHMQIQRDSYIQENMTFEPWSSTSSRSSPLCERYIYAIIENIQNDIDRETAQQSASVSSISSSPSITRYSNISEDIIYDLIQNNSHTLKYLLLYDITLRSKTKLSTILRNLPRLRKLSMENTTLPQQLLDSLQDLKRQRPYIYIPILNPQILPDATCTE